MKLYCETAACRVLTSCLAPQARTVLPACLWARAPAGWHAHDSVCCLCVFAGARAVVCSSRQLPQQQVCKCTQSSPAAGKDNSLHLLFSNMKYASAAGNESPASAAQPGPGGLTPGAATGPLQDTALPRPPLLPPAFFQGISPGGQVRAAPEVSECRRASGAVFEAPLLQVPLVTPIADQAAALG